METSPTLIEFDICGQICPSTLLTALREINRRKADLKERTVRLAFKTDNRDATSTIPEAVRNMGYAVSVIKSGGFYSIIVEREG